VLEYAIFDKLYWSSILNFNMQMQTQSNWCWAATSTSVSKYYSFLSPWTQCKVASAELDETCCNSPVPGPCNVPWYLDRALTRTNNFVSIQSGTLSWESVKNEIEKGLVVGARIGWNGGGGHFMVIHGVSRIGITKYLYIDDPIYGKSILTENQFATNYQGSGTWTHTYLTKKYFYFMKFKDYVFNPILLKPIPEVRPLLKAHYANVEINKRITDINLNLPHPTFSLKLSDIGRSVKLPDAPDSLRVIEFENEAAIALYDLALSEQQPEVLQLNTNDEFLRAMDTGIGRLASITKDKDLQGELRVVKIPALNIEALWLNFEGKDSDLFYLVRQFDENPDVMDEKTFYEFLRSAKTKQGKMDDTMGA
jgi:hypothetical protein